MREFKFRAWHNGYMRPIWSLGEMVEIEISPGETEWIPHTNNPNIKVMQYTGFLDKNGKEIFEGDIFGENPLLRCVVKVKEDGAFVLVFRDAKINAWSILDPRIAQSAIVGNIFQNPELLGDEA